MMSLITPLHAQQSAYPGASERQCERLQVLGKVGHREGLLPSHIVCHKAWEAGATDIDLQAGNQPHRGQRSERSNPCTPTPSQTLRCRQDGFHAQLSQTRQTPHSPFHATFNTLEYSISVQKLLSALALNHAERTCTSRAAAPQKPIK